MSPCVHVRAPCRLTVHGLQVLHVQGTGVAGTGCGRHGGEQVSCVGAPVACQQSHLVIVLSCGQTCVRGWSKTKVSGQQRSSKVTKKGS